MNRIEINIGGVDLVFNVAFEDDYDAGAPWEDEDGHGPVSNWTNRDKRPGELVLNKDRGSYRYYDFAEACRVARRERWDAAPYNHDGKETKRQQAAKAARANYEYLRKWCNDQWHYVGVIVTLLDADGNETEVSDSLWRVETFNDYHHEAAREIADDLAHGMGTRWDISTKSTFAWTKAA